MTTSKQVNFVKFCPVYFHFPILAPPATHLDLSLSLPLAPPLTSRNNFVHPHISPITSQYKFPIIPQAFSNISDINFPNLPFAKYSSPRRWVAPSAVFPQSLLWNMLFGLPYLLCPNVCVSRCRSINPSVIIISFNLDYLLIICAHKPDSLIFQVSTYPLYSAYP